MLLETDGRLKLADFGFSTYVGDESYGVCGSAEYVSPEMLDYQPHNQTSDLWQVGVISYVLLVGLAPFRFEGHYTSLDPLFDKIKKVSYKFPPHVSQGAKDFISKV